MTTEDAEESDRDARERAWSGVSTREANARVADALGGPGGADYRKIGEQMEIAKAELFTAIVARLSSLDADTRQHACDYLERTLLPAARTDHGEGSRRRTLESLSVLVRERRAPRSAVEAQDLENAVFWHLLGQFEGEPAQDRPITPVSRGGCTGVFLLAIALTGLGVASLVNWDTITR